MRNSKQKDVSFYVPVLNAGAYLSRCLSSILSQDYPIREIIVIDNGSTDDSARIAESFMKIDKRVKVVREMKKGLANARNTALKKVKGRFVASIDADCVIEPDWLSEIMKDFKDESIAGIGGRLVEDSRWRAVHLKQEWGDKRIINPPFLFGVNTVFRTDALKKTGGYNPRFLSNYEDVDVSKQLLAKNFKLVYEPKAVAHHLKEDNIFSLLKTFWAWGFYGNEPKNFMDAIKRLIFNVKKPLELSIEDLMNKRFTFLAIDFLILLSNPLFDFKYYFFRLKIRNAK